MMNRDLKDGMIVRHFKRETLSPEKKKENGYLYKIISVDGKNTETKGTYMVYQALYSPFTVFLRPINMALSEVNHNKYPDIKQKFRLEEITHEEFNEINTRILPDKLFRDIMGSMQTP